MLVEPESQPRYSYHTMLDLLDFSLSPSLYDPLVACIIYLQLNTIGPNERIRLDKLSAWFWFCTHGFSPFFVLTIDCG